MNTTGETKGRREAQPERERIERAERGIESARSAITDDLHALGEKFTPEHLKGEAKELARSAVGSAREAVSHGVQHTIELAHQQADRAKQNPLALFGAALLAGLGIGLLLPASDSGSRASKVTRRLRESVQGAASEVKGALQEGKEEIMRQT